jgi:hypothetical protein
MKTIRFQLLILQLLIILLFLGAGILEMVGYKMGDLAKSNLTKIFPGSYFLIFLFLTKLFNSPTNFYTIFKFNKTLSNYFIFILLIIFYLYVVNYASSISFILDTLTIPFLFFLYLKSCNINIQKHIPLFALNLILLNSIVAIVERVSNFNFFPIRQTFGVQFRSTAFLGHPLNNGLITVAFILFLLIIDMKHLKKITYLFILVLALFCFGARGSLLGSIIGIIILYILPIFISYKKYFYKINKTVTISIMIFLMVSFAYILLFTSFGERFRETSKDDRGSAKVRLKTLNLINIDNLSNYIWPISSNKTTELTKKAGVDVIENFIIIWVFKFGLLFTIALFYLLIKFLIVNSQIKNKYYAVTVIFLFFGVAATNNSLGSNTNALSFFILLFCFQNHKYKFIF